MSQIYNLTNVTNADNLIQLTQGTNQMTGELYGLFVLIAFFIILFASYRGQMPIVRLVSASFITTVVAMLFRVINLTGDLVVISFVLITAVSYIVMMYKKE